MAVTVSLAMKRKSSGTEASCPSTATIRSMGFNGPSVTDVTTMPQVSVDCEVKELVLIRSSLCLGRSMVSCIDSFSTSIFTKRPELALSPSTLWHGPNEPFHTVSMTPL